jgi:hypothetical protein
MIQDVQNMPEVDVQAALAAGLVVWEKMGPEGDIKSTWDPNNAVDVEAKRREFEYLTKEKKYRAYRVQGENGERGEPMNTFEAAAGRVIFVPAMQGG